MKAVIIFFVLLIALLDWGLCALSDPYDDDDDEKVLSGLMEEDE